MTDWPKPSESKDTWAIKRQRVSAKRCIVCGEPLKILMHQRSYCSRKCRLQKMREKYNQKKFGV